MMGRHWMFSLGSHVRSETTAGTGSPSITSTPTPAPTKSNPSTMGSSTALRCHQGSHLSSSILHMMTILEVRMKYRVPGHQHQPQTFAELTISDRYGPSLYYNTEDPIPLMESSELIQLNELVMVIKKGLNWCQTYVKEAQELGDSLEVQPESTTQTHKLYAYFQIVFLVDWHT
jgi:hypothetical protein